MALEYSDAADIGDSGIGKLGITPPATWGGGYKKKSRKTRKTRKSRRKARKSRRR